MEKWFGKLCSGTFIKYTKDAATVLLVTPCFLAPRSINRIFLLILIGPLVHYSSIEVKRKFCRLMRKDLNVLAAKGVKGADPFSS